MQVLPKFLSMQKVLNERDREISELRDWKRQASLRIDQLERELKSIHNDKMAASHRISVAVVSHFQ